MTITSPSCVESEVTLIPPTPELLSALLCVLRLRDFLITFSSSESNRSSTSPPEGTTIPAEDPLDALFRFVFFDFDPGDRPLSTSSSESIVMTSFEVEAAEEGIGDGGATTAATDDRVLLEELPAMFTG